MRHKRKRVAAPGIVEANKIKIVATQLSGKKTALRVIVTEGQSADSVKVQKTRQT